MARIDAALPQTQCQRCGYPDCASYARAIATENAAINQCPMGGAAGVQRLARLTGHSVQALNPVHGAEKPRALAVIDEAWCIGCTLCTKACPTDAIIGANKLMHTVIAEHCTGCELCVAACPVDCIALQEVSAGATGWAAWSPLQAEDARLRYEQRQKRLAQESSTAQAQAQAQAQSAGQLLQPQSQGGDERSAALALAASSATPNAPNAKQSVIAAVLMRARQRHDSAGTPATATVTAVAACGYGGYHSGRGVHLSTSGNSMSASANASASATHYAPEKDL